MDAFDAEPIVAEILANPEAEHALAELHRASQSSPAEGAAVLERLASSVAEAQPARASRWLVEAAALWSAAAGDPKRASRALRAAIELAPGDEEALARLVQLYRDNDKDASLARILERRAETMAEQAGRDPAALRRAADAFALLGEVLRDPPLDSAVEAIAAYHRAIATGAASADTYRAARALHLRRRQLAEAIPLFAMERARTTDPQHALALYREEAAVRELGGDGAGATDALRRARALAPDAAGLAEELGRSILARIEAAEPVTSAEAGEAAEIFAALAQASTREDAWRAAERCFVAAARWEDASWAAERRGDYPKAIELLAAPRDLEPEDRLRLALREARLCAVGLGDTRRAAARYTALLDELPAGCDAALIERLLRADRGGTGSVADVAAKLEAAALPTRHVRGLKLAFELAAHALAGVLRAAELVRQAEVLAGLGAERHLALRHAEAGLEGLAAADVGPLLERLSTLAAPDEAIDLYERHVGRCDAPAARASAIALAARAALKRGSVERMARFFDAVAVQCTDEPSLAALEKAAQDGDRKRGGAVLRGLFAGALAKAEPGVLDGGRTRAGLLRRAARVARRDLGDPDQAFEWLGDALFARLEGALEDALAPLADHADALLRTETAARELRAVLEREQRARGDVPASRPPPAPPPPPPRAASTPAPPHPASTPAPPHPASTPAPPHPASTPAPPHPAGTPAPPRSASTPAPPPRPTRAPPAPRVPQIDARSSPLPLELRDPFPASAAAPAPEVPFLLGTKRRVVGEELIADLFESMHAIDFCPDALEASAFTLTLAMDKLACGVGIAHLYDIDRREFVVVFSRGPGAATVRGLRTGDADPLAAEAMRTPGALMLPEGAADPRASGRRWDLLRASADRAIVSIACARVALKGRFLGMLELGNLEGGVGFAEGDEHALAYIAERFTEFVAGHGVVLGEEG